MMNQRIFNKIFSYQSIPETVLSCCKKFSIKRVRNIRWKNRIYFRDNRIKIKNCDNLDYTCIVKQVWYKYGKIHCDDIDPVSGYTFPSLVCESLQREWYKNGKIYRVDIDNQTGYTLPAIINDYEEEWYKDDKLHRDDIDAKTGFSLPAIISIDRSKYWHKNDKYHNDDIDPETGLTFPALNMINGQKNWHKNGKLHRDDIYYENGFPLPADDFKSVYFDNRR